MRTLRQGDVLLIARKPPRVSTRTDAAGLRVPGERTGHAHVLPAEVHVTQRGETLLHLAADGEMLHEEHGPMPVPTGWWEPRLQREFVPSARPARRADFD